MPPRSPIPFTVTWACSAPDSIATRELATAKPKSLWKWTLIGNDNSFLRLEINFLEVVGTKTPTVSGTLIKSAPASSTAL